MLDICLLGTGGMMPLPSRALTSLYARYDGKAVLIDCGEGTQTAIRTASLKFSAIEAILFTHFHADHISGLPGLLLTIGNEGRTRPLDMYGPKGLEFVVNSICVIVGELPFEIVFHEFEEECTAFECAGFAMSAFPLDHAMPCFGYCLQIERRGKFNAGMAKAKNIPMELWNVLQSGKCAGGFAPEDVLGKPRKGLKVIYATDTRPVTHIAQFGRDADLMILEGMFGLPEKQERAQISHHMMMHEAAQIAQKAGAKELWLTHFSPATPHPEEFAEELRNIFPNTVIGTDGMRAALNFE